MLKLSQKGFSQSTPFHPPTSTWHWSIRRDLTKGGPRIEKARLSCFPELCRLWNSKLKSICVNSGHTFLFLTHQSCDDQSIATSYCEDCEEYLCDDCVRAHRRVKMTKDHKITSVASSSKPSTKRATSELKDMTCQLHPGEKLNFYCEVCEKLTCRQCQMLPKCENHNFKTIEEIVPEMTNRQGH